jgi:hypothetical protein
MKKSLKDTYIYGVLGLDRVVPNCAAINAKLAERAIKGDALDAIINEIKYKISYPAKVRLIEDLKSGAIVLVDAHEAAAIPTWLCGDGHGGVKATVVNVFGKAKTNKDGQIQFNVREIFALAQMGLVIREFFTKESKIVFNQFMSKLSVVIFERMMYRVLDVLYSLDIGPSWLRNRVKIHLRFFALSYLLEKDSKNDSIYNFVLQDIAKQQGVTIDHLVAENRDNTAGVDEHGNEVMYSSLPGLIEGLNKLNPILKDLDIATFLRKFIMMYGEKALLSLENYSYFLAIMMSVSVSGNVVKDFSMESVIGKEGIQLYTTFFDVVKD